MTTITLIDTSVLNELLEVPGKCQRPTEVQAEFVARQHAGERFILPMTAIIETGNQIAQVRSNDPNARRGAAKRFVAFVERARAEVPPWTIAEITWGSELLGQLCAGDSTGQSFVDLAGNGLLGGGDTAILVERDLLRRRSSTATVQVWTLEAKLGSYP